jgi:hypothetical protein
MEAGGLAGVDVQEEGSESALVNKRAHLVRGRNDRLARLFRTPPSSPCPGLQVCRLLALRREDPGSRFVLELFEMISGRVNAVLALG